MRTFGAAWRAGFGRGEVRRVGAARGDVDHEGVVRDDGAEGDRDEAACAHGVGELEERIVHRVVAEGDDEDGGGVVPLAAGEALERRGRHAPAV